MPPLIHRLQHRLKIAKTELLKAQEAGTLFTK